MWEIFSAVFSGLIDVVGNGAIIGGKNAAVAAGSKIGWAKKGGGGRRRRLGGPSIAGKRLASRGSMPARTGPYNPKAEYQARMGASYSSARFSGTGAGGSSNIARPKKPLRRWT